MSNIILFPQIVDPDILGDSDMDNVIDETTRLYLEIIGPLTFLITSNNPKSRQLYDFITCCQENMLWYIDNKDKIGITDDAIIILGDQICIIDEESEHGVYGGSYFNLDSAIKHCRETGKKIPNWSKYIEFLPGDINNKYYFLTEVLGLKLNGFVYNGNRGFWGVSGNYISGELCGEDMTSFLHFRVKLENENGNSQQVILNPSATQNQNYFFNLRCIK